MKIIFKHIFRNILEKKGRSLLIIVSLLIASCVVILNLTIPNQIVESNTNKMKSLVGSTDVLVSSYEAFDLKDLKLNNEELDYVGVNQTFYIDNNKTVALYSTDISKCRELKLVGFDGDLKDNEIIINKAASEKFGYKQNDTITIEVNNEKFDLKVAGIEENNGLLNFKTYSSMVNENTYNKIMHVEGNTESSKYIAYYVDVKNDEKIEEFCNYVQDNNENYIVQELVDEDAIKENNAYVSTILMIIFVMASVMIYFVVNTLNKMIIIERMPVIGTFRSIGATKKKMNFILILENATYGFIGGILGSGFALAINSLCVKLLTGGEQLDTRVPFSNILIGILFAMLLEVLMSIGAIIKSNKYSIKEIMFDGKNSKFVLSKKVTVIAVMLIVLSMVLYKFTGDQNLLLDLVKIVALWLGVVYSLHFVMTIVSKITCKYAKKVRNGSLIIASKNLSNNKMLVSSTRLVVISISIMLVIFNVSATFDKMLNSFSLQFEDYDIFIRETSKENTEYSKLEQLDYIDRVENVYMYISDEVRYDGDKKFESTPVILGMKKSRPDIEEYNYKIQDLKSDELLVDSVYAENNNLKIGDKIKLNFKELGKEYEFKIVGTVNSFYYSVQREIVILNEDFFTENITKVPFQVTIAAKDNMDLKTVVEELEKELKDPNLTIMTVDEFVEMQRQNIHTIMYLFYIIIGLAVVLAFVGIINNQIISFMERTKELAVLNSVCMSKGQLIRMLTIENILSNVLACVIGFVTAILSAKIMNSVLNGIKMYINVSFDYKIAGIFIGVVLAVLLATVVIPIRKLKKINIVEQIKYE